MGDCSMVAAEYRSVVVYARQEAERSVEQVRGTAIVTR
jgi:hypothetical protein